MYIYTLVKSESIDSNFLFFEAFCVAHGSCKKLPQSLPISSRGSPTTGSLSKNTVLLAASVLDCCGFRWTHLATSWTHGPSQFQRCPAFGAFQSRGRWDFSPIGTTNLRSYSQIYQIHSRERSVLAWCWKLQGVLFEMFWTITVCFLVGGQYTGRKKHEETTCRVITIQRDRHSEYWQVVQICWGHHSSLRMQNYTWKIKTASWGIHVILKGVQCTVSMNLHVRWAPSLAR